MKADYDIIVMGTGPNSLVAASKCSAAGLSVAVISEKDEIGEQYQTRELIKDFHFNVGPLDAGVIEETIIKELKLKDHGLSKIQAAAEAFAPQKEGPGITLWQDLKKSQESIAQFSKKTPNNLGNGQIKCGSLPISFQKWLNWLPHLFAMLLPVYFFNGPGWPLD